jgi:hypothetical protein
MTNINNNNEVPDEPEEELAECMNCHQEYPLDELNEIVPVRDYGHGRSALVCDDCNDEATSCASCNRWVHEQHTVWVDNHEHHLCETCADRETHFCDDCDERHYDDDGCPRATRHIRSYSYKPNPIFFTANADEKLPKHLQTFTGFELEMEASECDREDGAELAYDLFNKWTYLKEDGSLNNGFEMVSHPLGYEFARDEFPWQNLRELSQLGMRSANTRTCGLHIHINRNIFDKSPSTMYRFMSMFYRNAEQWKRIAGRSESSYAEWSEYELEQMATYAKHYRGHSHNQRRYVAINLQNRHTLELRFFKGTLRPATFIARIEAAHAVAHYAYATRNNVSIKSAHDWERFREWTVANKYTHFDTYATEKGV